MNKMYKISWDYDDGDYSNHGNVWVKLPECVVEAYMFDGTHHVGIKNEIGKKLLTTSTVGYDAQLRDILREDRTAVDIVNIYEQGKEEPWEIR